MKYLFLGLVCIILSGCATPVDMTTAYLLNQRAEKEAASRRPKHYETIEISESVIIWKSGKPIKELRTYKLNVIVDEYGNFLIPPEKINKRFEMRN